MKISCTQENLNAGLNAVSHIASKNLNLPILSNVLFKSENKILTLMATNLEIGITTDIRGKVEGDGDLAVDARLLSSYVSLLPKERVDLDIEGEEMKIECQNKKTKVKIQSAGDFPLIPKLNKENPCILDAAKFKQAVSEVVFACSNSESRPELSGVYMEFSGSEVVLAATDSYRLSESRIKAMENNLGEKKAIIPSKTLQEVSRILSLFKDEPVEDGNRLEVYIGESQIMFSYDNIDIVSRLIEGQYPDYKQIVPTGFNTTAKANIQELVKEIKSSSLFTKSGIYDIKLEFVPDAGEMVITSSSMQAGESVSRVKAEITGEAASIVLNYRYLLDGLANMDGDQVEISIVDGNNPCLAKPVGQEGYFYIIMPIRQ